MWVSGEKFGVSEEKSRIFNLQSGVSIENLGLVSNENLGFKTCGKFAVSNENLGIYNENLGVSNKNGHFLFSNF